jgi:hypothetical protein
MLRVFLSIGDALVGRDTLRASYRSLAFGEVNQLGIVGLLVKAVLWPLSRIPRFREFVEAEARQRRNTKIRYFKANLDQSINSIYDLPDVVVTTSRVRAINFMVPAFSTETMSAGFFGVFHVALMVARQGYHVRLVLFDNFSFDKTKFRDDLQGYPGLEQLFDEVEVQYIGDRSQPLKVSPRDSAVATVWYSAYLARKVMAALGGGPFLYLIQDYEAAFHPANSLYAFADATYYFNYHALVSTRPLLEFLEARNSYFADLVQSEKAVYFNNACSARVPDRDVFLARSGRKSRKLAFYSRPVVNRNMFELGARALIEAWTRGYFESGHNWELYGIGIGDVEIELDAKTKLTQLPRMSLAQYEEKIREFDICLSLMASPHPSITPFDLAGVGAIVVTNRFENKTAEYFRAISGNIIVSAPDVLDLAECIRLAVRRVDDMESRFNNALSMKYPRDWHSVWQDDHTCLVHRLFGSLSERKVSADPIAMIAQHEVRAG